MNTEDDNTSLSWYYSFSLCWLCQVLIKIKDLLFIPKLGLLSILSTISFLTGTSKKGGSPQNWTRDPSHTHPLNAHAKPHLWRYPASVSLRIQALRWWHSRTNFLLFCCMVLYGAVLLGLNNYILYMLRTTRPNLCLFMLNLMHFCADYDYVHESNRFWLLPNLWKEELTSYIYAHYLHKGIK